MKPLIPTGSAAAFAVVSLAGAIAPVQAGEAARKSYDIAAGDAAGTLKRFADESGRQVIFLVDAVRGVTTNPVRGEFTVREALARLVADTGLVVTEDAKSGALMVNRLASHDRSRAQPKPTTNAMTPKSRSLLAALAGLLAVTFAPHAGAADDPAVLGVVTGRIYSPGSGEYLRNAQVRVVGGPSVASQDGGMYRLSGVAPGEVSLVVDFTGYRSATATVRVAPGETVTRDFELLSAIAAETDGTLKLGAFVVSGQRAGNAKAIMEQRNSMNITNSVSSDVFGDVSEGNVGEFLKHLPGVNFDAFDGTVRYVSLRGLASEYAGVTVDGMSFPSADANVAAGRAFSFEQVSLSAMESIEVSKTISADADASSPAGTINLKTKRAFDRAGRRITASGSVTMQSDQFKFRSYGPGDDRSVKVFPSAQIDYSDIFWKGRLGVVLGISESNSYLQRAPTTMTYNYTPTAASPDPVALTTIGIRQVHQTIERFATSLTLDYKATPHLVLSLSVMYNHSDVWSGQRMATFNTGARTTRIPGDQVLTDITSAANGSVSVEPQAVAKIGNGKSYAPRFEYTLGDLAVEGRFNVSDSVSSYDPMKQRDSVFSAGVMALTNVRFRAVRSSVNDGDWKIVQTAGPDWNDGAFFTSPGITVNDGRYSRIGLYTGEGIATYRTQRILPVIWKAGAKWKRVVSDYKQSRSASFYDYIGPGAGVGAFRGFRTGLDLDVSQQDISVASLSGPGIYRPDLMKVAELFRSKPNYFTARMTGTDFYNAYIANTKHYEEDVTALFLMGTAKLGKSSLRAGLRHKDTKTSSREFDALNSRQVTAAGFPVAAGRATTIPGVEYQFLSWPRIERTGSYDHLFPSASLKHSLTRNVDLQLGFSSTVKRPQFANVAGVWVINDDTLTITAPNVNLRPETSRNYSVRLARYFEPVGTAAINFFQNDIKGLHRSNSRIGGEQFNPGDPTYEGYTFVTTIQSENNVRVRGMELEYTQSLSFLPQPWTGFSVRASYTRNYAQVVVPNMAPHLVAAGLSYAHRRLQLYANMNWGASQPFNAAGTQYQRHRINVDLGGSLRLLGRTSAFFSVRNVLNEPFIRMEKIGNNPALAQLSQKFGVTPTVGLRATY